MGWLQALAAEFAVTLTDGSVWLSIGQGLLFGGVCLLFGIWVARWVGLLESDAPAGETLGVGLASGLLVLAAGWAAIFSGGRSTFTPVAVGFGIALALVVVRRRRMAAGADIPADLATEPPVARSVRRRNLVAAVLGGAAFVVAVALLYGSTLILSPRDGVQPIEFQDEAFYSILGADLAKTGTETIYSPSGFAVLDGLPVQTWYHWGELWLEAAVITVFGTPALDARHFVVLPILLLAAAALTGTLVRRMTASASRGAFLFGFLACLFLAPVPLAVGLIFWITTYGLAAVAVLLALYSLTVLARRQATWALATFVGSATALIVPAHVVIALLGLVGIGSVWTIRIAQSLVATRRLPVVSPLWRRTFIATGIAIVATVGWGLLTGHGVLVSGSSLSVSPFNGFWRESVVILIVCSGAFLAIAVAWYIVRGTAPIEAGMYIGTAVLLLIGALVWGARLGDLGTFHLFYAGLAVFATPVAAIAVASIWPRLRATGHKRMAIALLALCGTQLQLGVAFGIVRLQAFGPGNYEPVPVAILRAIEGLPADAKLAYACQPFEESAFWNAGLLGLGAHAKRLIIPLCFEAENLSVVIGGQMSANVPSPLFEWAPQRAIYPNVGSHPSAANVAAFLKANGVDYLYADPEHPNVLVADAILIATSGKTQVLRLP